MKHAIVKTKHINIFKIIVSMILLISCTSNNLSGEAEILFNEMYQNCEMNKVLRLSFVGKLYEGDKNTNFSLEPISNVSVIFPAGYNLRLLSFDDKENTWVEIKDNFKRLPADAKYTLGRNDPTKEHTQKLIGIIPSLGKKATIRLVVHGNTYENGVETSKCSGAFIDFEFIP